MSGALTDVRTRLGPSVIARYSRQPKGRVRRRGLDGVKTDTEVVPPDAELSCMPERGTINMIRPRRVRSHPEVTLQSLQIITRGRDASLPRVCGHTSGLEHILMQTGTRAHLGVYTEVVFV